MAAVSSACGGKSTPAAGGSAPCSPNGVILHVAAKNTAFDTTCLAAPDNTRFQIVFDNQDAGIPHTVSIYTNSSATTALFRGESVEGPAMRTYDVNALKAGAYYFRCDIHPTQMNGRFVVSGG